jgi:hypothetical protein
MSADWFCKVGDKQLGPLTSQQLKAMVAKGKLRPDYPLRRGSEGPWVPAGRVKGLFPDGGAAGAATAGQAKKAPPKAGQAQAAAARPAKVGGKAPPTAKPIPAAQAAAAPPASDFPSGLALGGHHGKHPTFNLDQFNVDAEIPITTHKASGVPGLKGAEKKKANMILLCVIGFGLFIVLILLIWAIASGKLNGLFGGGAKKDEAAKTAEGEAEKKTGEEKTKEKKDEERKDDKDWTKPGEWAPAKGNIKVKFRPTGRTLPAGVKSPAADLEDMLVLTVSLQYAKDEGDETEVKLAVFKQDTVLKDDKGKKLKLVDAVLKGDAKSIKPGEPEVQVLLVFEPPPDKAKYLHLELPARAFGEQGMRKFQVPGTMIPAAPKEKKAKKTGEDDPASKTKSKTKKTGDDDSSDAPKSKAKAASVKTDGDASDSGDDAKRPPTRKMEVLPPDHPGDIVPPLEGEQ